jgi:hypothetical protein
LKLGLDKNVRLYLKIVKAKRAEDMAQKELQCNKHEALSSKTMYLHKTNKHKELGRVIHSYDFSTWKSKAGELGGQDQCGLQSKTPSKKLVKLFHRISFKVYMFGLQHKFPIHLN